MPGAEGRYEWQGHRSLTDLPHSFNPPQHFLATANHNILPPDYRRELGYEWAAPYRFNRIAEVLGAADRKFTLTDFQRLQHDESSLPARELTRLLREAKATPPDLQPYVTLLSNWDCVLGKDSAAAALYEVWLTKLRPAIFKAHLPTNAWTLVSGNISLVKVIEVLKNPNPRWFGPEARAGRDAVLFRTLEQAVTENTTKLGQDPARWRWGSLHRAPFKHSLATDDKRRAVLDLPAVERGGDAFTVNATGGADFQQTAGASFRGILDLEDWDRSVASSVPGQSGQPSSQHYGDLLPLWAEGRYFPLLFSREKVEAAAKERLVLEPMR